ncbi:MAG: serine/threonine protein kinase [Anaerolineae bacterium]|nr:serine/threonine protein kinase [Phycisphaerae bacterium]
MPDAKHEQLRRVFDLVIAAPADQRESLLNRECGGDLEFRQRILAMIEAAEDARFLSAPTEISHGFPSSAATISDAPGETPGTLIGPYKLLQRIGEGGFGTVFMAEQEKPIKRRVALKIIKLGMDTRQVVARFEQERQALAMMDHPNIAKVFDAGMTESGRPYFVMELCTGEPIEEYCDRHNLSIESRLELFAQVCNAVQHAHTKGIIHRDIKPSNVLVATQDGRPSAKVIDFGIAKATASKLTEKTLFTEHKQLIGTPEYMSPEQAEGSLDIDTRTDVYSLGVLLYELLTGCTPFDSKELRSAAYGEIQRMIREVDPPKPSTRLSQNSDTIANVAAHRMTEPRKLGKLVRGELDWIVMKALEKDRQRRYETANGLAMDVKRYLSGEAVVAAPPSTVYRMRKFVRRNKAVVGSASAVAAALLIGLIAFAWQAKIARTQRDRAIVAEAETKKRADELKEVSEFQAKMLSQIDPTNAGIELMRDIRERFAAAIKKSGVPEVEREARVQSFARELNQVNSTDTAADLIDRTILMPAIKAVDSQFKNQPTVDASLRHTLAVLYKALGKYDQGAALQQHALATQRQVLGDDHLETIIGISDMGNLLEAQGKLPESEQLYREALERSARVLGKDHLRTQVSMSNLGNFLRDQGKQVEAEPLLRDALATARRVRGIEDRDSLIQLNTYGYLLIEQGKLDDAERAWTEVYETGKRVLGQDDPDVIVWINNMGGLRSSQGRAKEAEAYYRESLEAIRRVRGEEHPDVPNRMSNVAWAMRTQGRFADAEAMYREALDLCRRTLGDEHPNVIHCYEGLATVLLDQGKLEDAESCQRKALQIGQRVLGTSHQQTLRSVCLLAKLLGTRGKYAEAEALYREALTVSRPIWGDDNPDRLILLNNFGGMLMVMGRLDEAEPYLRQSYEARRKLSGEEHPETLITQNAIARLLKEQGKLAEAEPMLRDSLEKFRRVRGNDHSNTLNAILNYADILRKVGNLNEAEPLLREAVERTQRVFGNDHARTGSARLMLARLLLEQQRFADSEPELVEAQRIFSTTPGVPPTYQRDSTSSLAKLYTAWDTAEPGKGHDMKAAEWKTKLTAMVPAATTQSAK